MSVRSMDITAFAKGFPSSPLTIPVICPNCAIAVRPPRVSTMQNIPVAQIAFLTIFVSPVHLFLILKNVGNFPHRIGDFGRRTRVGRRDALTVSLENEKLPASYIG